MGTLGGDDDQWGEEQLRLAWVKLGGDAKRRDLNVRRGGRESLAGLNSGVAGRRTRLVYSEFFGRWLIRIEGKS